MPKRRNAVAARLRIMTIVLVTAGIASAGGSGAASAEVPARAVASGLQAASCSAGWSGPQSGMTWTALTAVTGIGRGFWAAGFSKRAYDIRRPTLVRRTAGGWTTVRLPSVARETGLFDVAAARDGRVWAVGYESDDRVYRPYVLRGGPGGMVRVSAPSFGSAGASLTAVGDGPGGVVAVGFSVGARGEVPLVAQRTSRGLVGDPVPGRTAAEPCWPSNASAGSTWAAGWQVTGSGVAPLVVRGVGSRWTRVGAPVGGGAILDLAAGPAGDVLWAVGYRLAAGRQMPAVWRHTMVRLGCPARHPVRSPRGVPDRRGHGHRRDRRGRHRLGRAREPVGRGGRPLGRRRWQDRPPIDADAELVLHDVAVGRRWAAADGRRSAAQAVARPDAGAGRDRSAAERGRRHPPEPGGRARAITWSPSPQARERRGRGLGRGARRDPPGGSRGVDLDARRPGRGPGSEWVAGRVHLASRRPGQADAERRWAVRGSGRGARSRRATGTAAPPRTQTRTAGLTSTAPWGRIGAPGSR